jgi:hypothetical protein
MGWLPALAEDRPDRGPARDPRPQPRQEPFTIGWQRAHLGEAARLLAGWLAARGFAAEVAERGHPDEAELVLLSAPRGEDLSRKGWLWLELARLPATVESGARTLEPASIDRWGYLRWPPRTRERSRR